MKLRDLGEFGLIDRISRIVLSTDPDILVSIGDDTACVKVGDRNWLLTVDTQVENVHFIKSKINPVDLGWKLSTSNVSDVVSCGGKPRFALVSVSLPKNLEVEFVEGVYRGIKEAQEYYGFKTIGGNITSSNQIMVDMTLIGESQTFIPRSSAKEGQYVYLTGFTGLSRVGLEMILSGKGVSEEEVYFIKRHYRPLARLDKLNTILRFAKSSIDISDGLVSDLYHISEQSGVKIVLEKDRVPVDDKLRLYCLKNRTDPYDYILYGGEDYQIVFTSDELIEEEDIYLIGYVERGEGVYIKEEGRVSGLSKRGFNHLV
ncbi:MAG: thiamine-phosphate kinase [Hydrogenothermaceae bacterium]|nr:thiamine-phosphate kinase [Hydrogenothermaceae bacterium]